jgi:hypothetical protein
MDLRFLQPLTNLCWKHHHPLCHPDRSVSAVEGSAVQRNSHGNVFRWSLVDMEGRTVSHYFACWSEGRCLPSVLRGT